MLDRLTYVSSIGNTIEFGNPESHILINTNNLRDYGWSYSQSYKHITEFSKNLSSKTLPILIYGSDVKSIADNLFETIENDVLLKKYGRLYSGDYYISGYFTGSSKTSYTADGFLKLNLTFVTDRPYWVRETSYQYRPDSEELEGLSYPYGYPYDFLASVSAQDIINPSFTDQNIRLIIYGECVNPVVMIDDHIYGVNVMIDENEYVTIDTAEKTIVLTRQDGTSENVFNARNRNYYIFQKITKGKHTISVLPVTNVDLTILEERSEPKWQ